MGVTVDKVEHIRIAIWSPARSLLIMLVSSWAKLLTLVKGHGWTGVTLNRAEKIRIAISSTYPHLVSPLRLYMRSLCGYMVGPCWSSLGLARLTTRLVGPRIMTRLLGSVREAGLGSCI